MVPGGRSRCQPARNRRGLAAVDDRAIDHFAWLRILGPSQSPCPAQCTDWRFATSHATPAAVHCAMGFKSVSTERQVLGSN